MPPLQVVETLFGVQLPAGLGLPRLLQPTATFLRSSPPFLPDAESEPIETYVPPEYVHEDICGHVNINSGMCESSYDTAARWDGMHLKSQLEVTDELQRQIICAVTRLDVNPGGDCESTTVDLSAYIQLDRKQEGEDDRFDNSFFKMKVHPPCHACVACVDV